MGVIKNVALSDPLEREKWAHEWMQNVRDMLKGTNGDPAQTLAILKELSASADELLAVILTAVVKEEYMEDMADLIEVFLDVRRSLASQMGQAGMQPGMQPGMPPGMPPTRPMQ